MFMFKIAFHSPTSLYKEAIPFFGMLPSGPATIWQAWHLYQNGIVGGEKGASEFWDTFIFF